MPVKTATATLITVAPTGAEVEKAAVQALPVTLDELVATAKECQAAGAAVIHVHIRDDQARPTLDPARLADTVRALREATDLIVQLSTGGAVTDPLDRRLAGARRRPGRVLADLRHRQLRRRGVPELLAVHPRAVRAHPATRRRARVRAVRSRSYRHAAPAAR